MSRERRASTARALRVPRDHVSPRHVVFVLHDFLRSRYNPIRMKRVKRGGEAKRAVSDADREGRELCDAVLHIRLPKKEHREFMRKAREAGKNLSRFIRELGQAV